MDATLPFSDEQRRVLVNLEQHYETWIEAERALRALPYALNFVERSGKEYLYERLGRTGSSKSLGPRSPETEQIYETYQADKAAAETRISESRSTLQDTARLYRALRLPQISTEAAKVLREADMRKMLGTCLMVVGTNAIAAYSIEAGGFIRQAPDTTDDFDMSWIAETPADDSQMVLAMLKAVDSTYTVNTERSFQARNAKAHEFELLAAPSTLGAMARNDGPKPIPLPEQEWLLKGRHVSHVVIALDGSPARIVAPDPRWFGLQKLWMARQEKRHPLKRPKDETQGFAVLNAVLETMPQFPMDDAFEAEVPDELRDAYAEWKAQAPEPPKPGW